MRHDSLDVLVGLVQLFGGTGRAPRMRKDDFTGAYKTLPIRGAHLDLAVSLFLGPSGLQALELWACPFGALGSVYAWDRLGGAVQLILAELFLIPYARYMNDLLGADPAGATDGPVATAELARFVIEDLLGWELDHEKAREDAAELTALGVKVRVSDDEVKLRVGDERAARWVEEIGEVLRSERRTPGRARKLAGKLGWGACEVFGRGARVYLAPLFRHAESSSAQIPGRLRRALEWWCRYLSAVPVCGVPLAPRQRRRMLLYSDATGRGRLAWVAEWGSERRWASTSAPSWLHRWALRRRNQVATW